jgi:hypothetical protein
LAAASLVAAATEHAKDEEADDLEAETALLRMTLAATKENNERKRTPQAGTCEEERGHTWKEIT